MRVSRTRRFRSVYLANIFLALHYYIILYVNSSYLGEFFGKELLSFLYILGSALSLFLLLNAPLLLNKFGNYRLILAFSIAELFAVGGLALTKSPLAIAAFFTLHQAMIIMISWNLDIFLEANQRRENHTGEVRGVYLTAANIILVLSPSFAAFILNWGFNTLYFVSALLILPLFFLAKYNLKTKNISPNKNFSLAAAFNRFRKDKNISSILFCALLLQFFYAGMVIYMPIYLQQFVGFSWAEIGALFTIMLLPFVLFELPAGEIADKKLGEKEILFLGFGIIGLTTILVSLTEDANFILWAILLFMTRVGASFVEITTESYFFKHVKAENADVISIFRITKPVAFIAAPAIAALAFFLFGENKINYSYLFLVLGILMSFGLFFSLRIKDTR